MSWSEIEAKWQKAWKEAHIYEPTVDESKPKFYLTVPYPYVNAPMHIGHGRTFLIGDIIARYKRLRGYNVLWPLAFHLSGTPVLAVADKISSGDKKTIELYKDYVSLYIDDQNEVERIVSTFTSPENIAKFFAKYVAADFESVGFGMDLRRQFTTIDPEYNRFVEWQYHKLKEKGLLVKGAHPVLYSPKDESAVGEDDIKDGDLDKVAVMEFTAIKYRFEDGYLVAATLRPETIFGVTNLWINPNATYVKARVGEEIWYISKEAAEKLKYQKESVDVLSELSGSYFIDKTAEIIGITVPILPANFVDPDNATGVVYSVPAHAPYDYIALYDLQKEGKYTDIKPVTIIDIPGYSVPAKEICERMGIENQNDPKLEDATKEIYKLEFYKGILNERCQQFAGMKINQIKDEVKVWMRGNNLADVFYETSRKAVTRSGNKVIVAVLRDQWFIDYSKPEWKAKAHEWVDKMFIYPEKYRRMFHDTIDWLHERPCARKRGLGTKLPFDKEWVIESLSDSTIYMALYTIIHKIKELGIEPTQEFFDYVFLGKGDPKEGWDEAKKEFDYWYPNDLRHTAPAHISNHLTFFIMHHIAIFDENDWPRGISLNEMLIREGAKMSKSKGNVLPLVDISKQYTADLFRLYLSSAADLDSTLDWKENEVLSVKKKLEEFRSIVEESIDTEPNTDNWLYKMFNYRLSKATEHYDSMKFRDAVIELFFNMLNDIKRYRKHSNYKNAVSGILDKWLIALSPIIPHTSEEYWHRKYGDSKGSVVEQEWPSTTEISDEFLAEIRYVDSVIADIKKILGVSKEQHEKVYIYTAEDWTYDVVKKLASGKKLPEILNDYEDKGKVAGFVKRAMKEGIVKSYADINEVQILKDNLDMISAEVGLDVEINSDYDPANKKQRAIPMRPAIYLE